MTTTKIAITGMHCASCAKLITETCREFPGVSSCTVDFGSATGTIEHDGALDLDALRKEIATLGEYDVRVV